MVSFFNVKKYFRENRQVYFIAIVIVFVGFLAGAFYSNTITDNDFESYSNILAKYIKNVNNQVGIKDTYSDTVNIIMIFFWSFFLFGKPFSCFFAFKSGFSIGFYITFFVKVYKFKGFLAGLSVLFNYLFFSFVPVILVTTYSLNTNMYITESVYAKSSNNGKKDIKRLFVPYLLVLIVSLLATNIGNYLNFILMPKIINAIF